jgi:hypothetical protein
MLLWGIVLGLFSANLVVSKLPSPELLADYDPNTSLQPLEDTVQGWGTSENVHVIRGLLELRNVPPSKRNVKKRDPSSLRLIPGLLMSRTGSPSESSLQKRDPSNLRLIPGLLMSRMAFPSESGLQKRDPSALRLIRGLLKTRDASPGILVDYDRGTALQRPQDGSQTKNSSNGLHVIRGLLVTRQKCPTGYGQCSNAPQKSVSLIHSTPFLSPGRSHIPLPSSFKTHCCCVLYSRNDGALERGYIPVIVTE